MPESDGDAGCDAVPLECHAWTPLAALAQRVSALAHRDLFRTRRTHHRRPGFFSFCMAGKGESDPTSGLDRQTRRRGVRARVCLIFWGQQVVRRVAELTQVRGTISESAHGGFASM